MAPDGPPHRRRNASDGERDGSAATRTPTLSRRQFASAGAAALATGLAGCAGGPSTSTPPTSIDSWPPDPDGSPLVARTYYPEWIAWANRAFEAAGIDSLGSPFAWDVTRPFGDGAVGRARRWLYRATNGSSYEGPRRAIDLVSVQDWRLADAIDLLHPLPVDRMPAWKHVRDRFADVDFYRRDGETYGVPVEGTLFPLTYDTEVYDGPPSSWEALFDSEFAGDAVWGASGHDLAKTAALYTGQNPRQPDDFAAIRDVLERHRDRLDRSGGTAPVDDFFVSSREAVQAFASGDAVIGSVGMSEMYTARFERGASIDYTAPAEGALYQAFFFGVPAEAPHPLSSTLFVDWALRPANAARLFELETFVPAVDVGDHVADDVAAFFAWPDEWNLVYDDPRTSEETEVRYATILREVYDLY